MTAAIERGKVALRAGIVLAVVAQIHDVDARLAAIAREVMRGRAMRLRETVPT
jgi:hypothetical protein